MEKNSNHSSIFSFFENGRFINTIYNNNETKMNTSEFLTELISRLTKDDSLICEADDPITITKTGYWVIKLYKDRFLFTGSFDSASVLEVRKIIDYSTYIIAAVESYETI